MPVSILDALQVISGASPQAIRQFQTHDYYLNARRKLLKTSKHDRVDTLLQGLCDILPSVKQILNHEPDAAVGSPVWEQEDARFIDIQIARGKCTTSSTQRFRGHLAHRSLALEFKDWETRQNLVPRVVIVADNLLKAEDRNGNSSRFFQSKGYPKNGRNALVHGNKILIAEILSGTRAISLLLAFQYTSFWGLKYNEFSPFVQKLPDIFRKLLAEDGDAHGDNNGYNIGGNNESDESGDNDGDDLCEEDESDDYHGNSEEDQRIKEMLGEMEGFLDKCQESYNHGVRGGVNQNPKPSVSETTSAGHTFDLPLQHAEALSTQILGYDNTAVSTHRLYSPLFMGSEVLPSKTRDTVQGFETGESTTRQEGVHHHPTATNALLPLRLQAPIYPNTTIAFGNNVHPITASAVQLTQQYQIPDSSPWVGEFEAYHTSSSIFSSNGHPADILYPRLLGNHENLAHWPG